MYSTPPPFLVTLHLKPRPNTSDKCMYLPRPSSIPFRAGSRPANQVAVESVILQQENGSMAQRVQAEFLSELCRRIEAACPDRPPGPGMLE